MNSSALLSTSSGRARRHGPLSLLIGLATLPVLYLLGQAQGTGHPEDPRLWNQLFWIETLLAFGIAWNTFEVVYRSEQNKRLNTLPVTAHQWYKEQRAALIHTLGAALLAGMAYLLPHAPPEVFANFAAFLALTGTGCLVAQLRLGETLLEEAGPLQRSLGGGLPDPQASLLFYSPAFAFGGSLGVAVALEFGGRLSVLRSQLEWNWAFLVIAVGLAFLLERKARHTFIRSYPRIFPRFADSEYVPPYAEKGLLGPGRLPSSHRLLAHGSALLADALRLSVRRAHRVDLFFLAALLLGLVLFLRQATTEEALFVGSGLYLCGGFYGLFRPFERLWGTRLTPIFALKTTSVTPHGITRGRRVALSVMAVPVVGSAMIVGLFVGEPQLAQLGGPLVGAALIAFTSEALALVFSKEPTRARGWDTTLCVSTLFLSILTLTW